MEVKPQRKTIVPEFSGLFNSVKGQPSPTSQRVVRGEQHHLPDVAVRSIKHEKRFCRRISSVHAGYIRLGDHPRHGTTADPVIAMQPFASQPPTNASGFNRLRDLSRRPHSNRMELTLFAPKIGQKTIELLGNRESGIYRRWG